MALLKHSLVTLAALLVGVIAWMALDDRPARLALAALPEDATTLRGAILALSPHAGEPPRTKIGATPSGGERGRNRPVVVVAGAVGEAETRTQVRGIGSGEAERSVTVYPDTTGIVASVAFKSGDRVESGAPLAILEHDNEELAVARARIGLDAAEEKFQRYQRLAQSRAVTSVEANDVARERDNARLDLRAAEIALAKRTISAPLAGHVGIVNVEPGDLVSNQSTIATIDDRTRLRVIFYTPESFIGALAIGAPIEAVASARPEKSYGGTISAIDSRIDEASRTLRTEALLDNAADELRPGMSFLVTLRLEGERRLAVDPLAVQWERDGAFVWKIAGNRIEKTPVRIVERNIDSLLLTADDLKRGDQVVVEGVQSVREGGTVDVRDTRPAPTGPARDDGALPPAAERNAPAADRRAEAGTDGR